MLTADEVQERIAELENARDKAIAESNAQCQVDKDAARKRCREAVVKWRRVLRALEAEKGQVSDEK